MYRRLIAPTATRGLLRIRTSSELQLTRFYGPLVADESHDNLAHVALADTQTTFAFDLRHTQSGRLQGEQCMQLAFSYTAFVPWGTGQAASR